MYADRDWVTPLRISPQTCMGLFLFDIVFIGGLLNSRDIPVSGRGTSVRWHNVHACLLVTFDYCFFSSDLITSIVIITTHGFFFDCGRLVLCQYGQCLIYSGTLAIVLFYCLVVAWFLSSDVLSAMEQAGPSYASSAPLAGTFLRLSLDLASDQLYDLAPEIPDVMGLRALRASAAIVKVMSVPDSRCIRVVAPDDHVNIGFHEVLLHDMEDEDIPFVALSELDCLRQGWSKPLFVFMSRYQHDLEWMRRECKERFGCTQSGNCTHCGKLIQKNLGKHIALFHMELAQLWRCPVTWCTVWKGTAQDCMDYLLKTHEISQSMKAANLARYFPSWTVTRSQWSEMTRPTISGVAIDTLLFSHIGVPLFHRYRIISRAGTHAAFRGMYMRWLHVFLEEMDEESVCRPHRRRAQEMAARMSLSSCRDSGCFCSTLSRSPDSFPGPAASPVSAGGPVF